jgi:MFS family permease
VGVAAIGALFVQTAAQVLPLLVIAGIGNAAVSTLTWPLMMQLVPTERTGVFAGLKTAAESISAFFSAFLAFEMVSLWGYRSIFLVLTLAAGASLAMVLAVRIERAQPAPALATAAA